MAFNDGLAVILVLLTVLLWGLDALGELRLHEAVRGALIVTWTLVVQFYFRKARGGP
mgnify:CR=1 FL=1